MKRRDKKKRQLAAGRRKRAKRIGNHSYSIESLEDRLVLAAVSVIEGTDGVEFEITGSLIGDTPNVHVRTSDSGQLQYSQDGSNFTDLSYNLADGSLDALSLDVVYANPTNEEYATYVRNVFNEDTDLITTMYVGNMNAPGVDLSFSALDIEVEAGATLSTRDIGSASDPLTAASVGDSGDISFYSPIQDIGGNVLANVGDGDTTNTAGDITIDAIGKLDDISSGFTLTFPVLDINNAYAKVNLDSATMRGGDISINVDADASDLFSDGDPAQGFGEALAEYVGLAFGAGWRGAVRSGS